MPTTTDSGPAIRKTFLNRRSSQMTLVAVIALAGLLWYLNSPAAVSVADAEVGGDDITAIVNSCGAELTVEAYEDDSWL